ncbi:MAG: ribulose-phosphate 3-epimerase [Candidatus Coatesbacteria bacterium]|nr:MAG: ribulose-phosphate 3-epimerase [Candidatus Coatesbacteria bacterium]
MARPRPELAPSLLSADFGRMAEATRLLREAGLKYVHLDVMDGVFVPNVTFGPKMVADLRAEAGELVMIAHLMISQPERYVDEFAAAGADVITVHAEATAHLHRALQQIRAAGKQAGVALNPATPLAAAEEVLESADFLLVMTVNPGFGGQKFVDGGLEKIARARARLDEAGRDVRIEVDGGVKLANIKQVAKAGADVIVAGSAVFGAADPAQAISDLVAALNS